jgi:hypothetical protein
LILVEQFIGGISILFYLKYFAQLTGEFHAWFDRIKMKIFALIMFSFAHGHELIKFLCIILLFH